MVSGVVQQTLVLPGFIYYSAVFIAREKGQRRHQALGRLAVVQQTAIPPCSVAQQDPGLQFSVIQARLVT